MEQKHEFPGNSPKKKRNPQSRDRLARVLAGYGVSLGSGISNERGRHIAKTIEELRENGHAREAEILSDTFNTAGSIRGTYEIVRGSRELFFALCEVVANGEAHNLLEARKSVRELVEEEELGNDERKPIKVYEAKNEMYRITSTHNHSSILVSAHDLIELSDLLQYIMPELQAKESAQ